ncbi:hypothetical protein [Streptomyces virginiae]|uniref:hypothetical protein n=1 Tax=Streptomyces virginiae TaxID=1961 RepID=UPI003662ABCD
MTGEPARRRDVANAGAHWIAGAHHTPDTVWGEWDGPLGVALVPAGRAWDAVAMPYDRLLAVMADMGPLAWKHRPVLVDLSSGRTYVLVPTGTAETWQESGTTPIGDGFWLVMSRPGGVRESRVGHWVNPPGLLTRLADPAELSASLRRTASDDHRNSEEAF